MIGSLKKTAKSESWLWKNEDLLNIICEYVPPDEKFTLYHTNQSLRKLLCAKFPCLTVDPLFAVWFFYSDDQLRLAFKNSSQSSNLLSRQINPIQFLQYHEGDILQFKQRLLNSSCISLDDIKETLGWEVKSDFNAKYITPKEARAIIKRYKDNQDLDPTVLALKEKYNLSHEAALWIKWFKDSLYTTV